MGALAASAAAWGGVGEGVFSSPTISMGAGSILPPLPGLDAQWMCQTRRDGGMRGRFKTGRAGRTQGRVSNAHIHSAHRTKRTPTIFIKQNKEFHRLSQKTGGTTNRVNREIPRTVSDHGLELAFCLFLFFPSSASFSRSI
jgi:hypothetical protein